MSAEAAAIADLVGRGKDLQIHESIESAMDRTVEMGPNNYSQGAAPGAAPQHCISVMEEPQEGAATKERVP